MNLFNNKLSTSAIVKRYKRLLARRRCARVHSITVQYVGFADLISLVPPRIVCKLVQPNFGASVR